MVNKPFFSWLLYQAPFRFLRGMLLSVYLLLVAGPLLAVIVGSLSSYDSGWQQELMSLFSARRLGLLWNSLALAGVVSVAGMTIGFLLGLFLWTHPGRLSRLLYWILLTLFMLPPYLHALTWMTIFSGVSRLLPLASFSGFLTRGWFGVGWVQLIAWLPVAALLTQVGLAQVNPALWEAGRLSRGDGEVLRLVALPLAAPWLWVSGAIIFIFSFMDYSVPYLFDCNVYALEVFAGFSAHHQPARALISALPLMFISLALVGSSVSRLRTAFVQSANYHQRFSVPIFWSSWLARFQWAAVGVVITGLLAPVVSLAALTIRGPAAWMTLKSSAREIAFTFQLMLFAGLLCLLLAQVVADRLRQPLSRSAFWWLVTLLPLAVPGSLFGIGHLLVWNRPLLSDIFSSGWGMLLAHVGRFAPLAALMLLSASHRQDAFLFEAAQVFQRNSLHGWRRVHAPLKSPTWLAAACFVAILSASELAASLMVVPPGFATLTLRIYNYLHYGSPQAVAALSLMLLLLGLGASGLVNRLLTARSAQGTGVEP